MNVMLFIHRNSEMGERKVNLPLTIDTQEDMDGFENNDWVKSFIESDYSPDIFDQNAFYVGTVNGLGWAEYGMVQFFNRQVYIDGYLENEGSLYMQEWTPQMKTLGYNIGRVDTHAYHLETRTQNSWYTNPHMVRNNQLWEELKVLSKGTID